jgi:hypothetical protein
MGPKLRRLAASEKRATKEIISTAAQASPSLSYRSLLFPEEAQRSSNKRRQTLFVV